MIGFQFFLNLFRTYLTIKNLFFITFKLMKFYSFKFKSVFVQH